jgi:hypothetical protein
MAGRTPTGGCCRGHCWGSSSASSPPRASAPSPVHTHTHAHTHAHARTHTHTHTQRSAPTCLGPFPGTHTHTHTRTRTHTHTHTHTTLRLHVPRPLPRHDARAPWEGARPLPGTLDALPGAAGWPYSTGWPPIGPFPGTLHGGLSVQARGGVQRAGPLSGTTVTAPPSSCRGPAEGLQRACRGPAEGLQRACRGPSALCRGPAEGLQRACRGPRPCAPKGTGTLGLGMAPASPPLCAALFCAALFVSAPLCAALPPSALFCPALLGLFRPAVLRRVPVPSVSVPPLPCWVSGAQPALGRTDAYLRARAGRRRNSRQPREGTRTPPPPTQPLHWRPVPDPRRAGPGGPSV